MSRSRTHELLGRVAARERLARLGRRLHLFLLVIAGAYLLLLLTSRLTGLGPDWFAPRTSLTTVLALPAACLIALVSSGRPSAREAARLVDTRARTHDLFLTAVLLEGSAGEYKPIVRGDAEVKAESVEPAHVVPFRPWPKVRDAAVALAAVCLAVLLLPQLDPFGRQKERERHAERRARLDESAKTTKLRSKILKEKAGAPEADEVDRALADLKRALRSMKPGRKLDLKRLSLMQRELSALWRKTSEKKLADSLRRSPLSQRFGSPEGTRASRWKKELREGKADALQKELARLKEKAKKLAEATDPAEREKLRSELRQGLKTLAEFAERHANSRDLANAISRAMEQLGMSALAGLDRDALRELAESLDLAGMEIAGLAKQLRELQRLEDALEAAQLAKALGEMGQFDGASCAGCEGIADYAAFYRDLLGQMGGRGPGPGMGGPGMGRGGEAPEDPDAETDFKSELSRSDVTAGKMLLEWKVKGLSAPGRARENYRRAVREVTQSWSEAALRERVPPGYREAIRKYFDYVEKAGVSKAGMERTEGDAVRDNSGAE